MKELDHRLTEEILIDLRQILDKEGNNSSLKWLSEYRDYFDAEILNSLDSYDFFTLVDLLDALDEEPNSNFRQMIEQSNHFSLCKRYFLALQLKKP